ncbi:DNA alkylation repair protein [Sutterella sp.]|uniref:DNA alkylation repair protein n=1 Tax=Sutterella sp. TaxID=1981025 RepID=UPI0026DFB0F3|nr:DNA alkylation repair protein [Sutterella sp.]MDO5532972.1 DNA alkylation repair protein [Sutterella sp.]
MTLDALHLRLLNAAVPRNYDTIGVMTPGVRGRIGVPMGAVRQAARDVLRAGAGRALVDEALDPARIRSVRAHEVIEVIGLVIAGLRGITFAERLALTEAYLPLITNWATCDLFCGAMKPCREHPEESLAFIDGLLKSGDVWRIRVGLVLLLEHFAAAPWTARALKMSLSAPVLRSARNAYYVSMALAWALSVFFVEDPVRTEKALRDAVERGKIDSVTARRATQKVRDSFRVTRAQKADLSQNIAKSLAERPPEKVPENAPPRTGVLAPPALRIK